MDYYNYYNNDDIYSNVSSSIGRMLIIIYLILVLGMFLFFAANYIIRGIGMYTIASRRGFENPWLAFIPFARTYLHGELAGEIRLKNKTIKNPGIWYLALPFVAGLANGILYIIFCIFGIGMLGTTIARVIGSGSYDIYNSYSGYGGHIGGLVGSLIVVLGIWLVIMLAFNILYKVFGILINRQVFGYFTSDNMSTVHAVLSVFVPLYESICYVVMRNRPFEPGKEPDDRGPIGPGGGFGPVVPTMPGPVPGAGNVPEAPAAPEAPGMPEVSNVPEEVETPDMSLGWKQTDGENGFVMSDVPAAEEAVGTEKADTQETEPLATETVQRTYQYSDGAEHEAASSVAEPAEEKNKKEEN